jgi:TPR repeat protein
MKFPRRCHTISERPRRAALNERDIGTNDPAFTLEMRRASWDVKNMAEAPAACDQLPPTGVSAAARAGSAADGQPVQEVPPLIEFGDPLDRAEPAADQPPTPPDDQTATSTASQRPPRRSFLAPVSRAPAPVRRRPTVEAEAAAQVRQEPPAGRHWRRRLGVGIGIAAALGLAVAAQIGINGDWFDRLKLATVQYLPGPKPPPGSVEAPSQRVLQETERAKSGDAEAQLSLAILYAKGDGVAQDYAAAAKWFRAAADRGLMRAQYDLGVLYERGRGVPLDYDQAVNWYRKAAEQGHPLAQYNLAVAHTKGQGVRQNFFEAAVWYHRSAALGVVAAMVNLAILYERGEGVESSTVDAYAWYRAAARRGSQPAARRAEELLQAFSPLEQTRAEAKALDINASVRDAIGDGARLAARKPGAPVTADSGPVLKSGLDSARGSQPGETRAENR